MKSSSQALGTDVQFATLNKVSLYISFEVACFIQ